MKYVLIYLLIYCLNTIVQSATPRMVSLHWKRSVEKEAASTGLGWKDIELAAQDRLRSHHRQPVATGKPARLRTKSVLSKLLEDLKRRTTSDVTPHILSDEYPVVDSRQVDKIVKFHDHYGGLTRRTPIGYPSNEATTLSSEVTPQNELSHESPDLDNHHVGKEVTTLKSEVTPQNKLSHEPPDIDSHHAGKQVTTLASKSTPSKVKPSTSTPSKVKSSKVVPSTSTPSKVKPSKAKPSKVVPSTSTPSKVTANKVNPSQAKPSTPAPSKVKPSKVNSSQVTPSKVASGTSTPSISTPSKVRPSKVKPSKVRPSKWTPSKVTDQNESSYESSDIYNLDIVEFLNFYMDTRIPRRHRTENSGDYQMTPKLNKIEISGKWHKTTKSNENSKTYRGTTRALLTTFSRATESRTTKRHKITTPLNTQRTTITPDSTKFTNKTPNTTWRKTTRGPKPINTTSVKFWRLTTAAQMSVTTTPVKNLSSTTPVMNLSSATPCLIVWISTTTPVISPRATVTEPEFVNIMFEMIKDIYSRGRADSYHDNEIASNPSLTSNKIISSLEDDTAVTMPLSCEDNSRNTGSSNEDLPEISL